MPKEIATATRKRKRGRSYKNGDRRLKKI